MDDVPGVATVLQDDGCSARAVECVAIFAIAGGGPTGHAPCNVGVACTMQAVEIEAEIGDAAPDVFPLVAAQGISAAYHHRFRAERRDVLGEESFSRVVVDGGAVRAQALEKSTHGGVWIVADFDGLGHNVSASATAPCCLPHIPACRLPRRVRVRPLR